MNDLVEKMRAELAEYHELAARKCAEAGVDPAEFERLCKTAEWGCGQVRYEFETPDWFDRLRARAGAIAARIARDHANKLYSAIYKAVSSGGPTSMLEVSEADLLASVPPKLQKDAAELQVGQGGRLILGPTGARKTWTCIAITRRIVREAFEAHHADAKTRGFMFDVSKLIGWARAVDLGNARQESSLGSEPPAILAAQKPRLLILDDLGWESARDRTVAEVLAHRYDHGLQTIVTSGQTFVQLVERYGEAMVRRPLESGGKAGKIVSLFAETKPLAIAGGR